MMHAEAYSIFHIPPHPALCADLSHKGRGNYLLRSPMTPLAHTPVMLEEVLSYLKPKDGGQYLEMTLELKLNER